MYTPAQVTGGAAPVTVTCSPESGSTFPLGATSVNCTVSDVQARQAACSFKVTLSGVASTMSVKTYEAIGDSLTEGELGRPSVDARLLDIPNAYPTKLQQAFDAAYPGQDIVVINRGHSGDRIEKTLAELPGHLLRDKPDAVLLLGGYNNLTGACGPGQADSTACRSGVEDVAFGVRDCIRRTKESSVGVRYTFVSTLTPPGATGSNRIDANAIIQANVRIRQMVAAEGAVLVDSYGRFLGHEPEYVNVDGLHLRPAGYQALADGFFDVIRATVPQAPPSAAVQR